jgi:predicted transcriptional regulator
MSANINSNYEREMRALVAICNELATNMTWREWAEAADLGVGTIFNLCSGKTKYPRFLTIQKMSRAVGLHVELRKDHRVKMRLVG